MKLTTKLLNTSISLLLTPCALSEIVYQDTFDDQDGIATNAGIGGGLVSGTNISAGDPFDDATGDAVAQTNFGNRIAWAWPDPASWTVLNCRFS